MLQIASWTYMQQLYFSRQGQNTLFTAPLSIFHRILTDGAKLMYYQKLEWQKQNGKI
jgi:hypothetical protein